MWIKKKINEACTKEASIENKIIIKKKYLMYICVQLSIENKIMINYSICEKALWELINEHEFDYGIGLTRFHWLWLRLVLLVELDWQVQPPTSWELFDSYGIKSRKFEVLLRFGVCFWHSCSTNFRIFFHHHLTVWIYMLWTNIDPSFSWPCIYSIKVYMDNLLTDDTCILQSN